MLSGNSLAPGQGNHPCFDAFGYICWKKKKVNLLGLNFLKFFTVKQRIYYF
jgi:hypothetical protein